MNTKLPSGSVLPALILPLVGGGKFTLGSVKKPGNWQVVLVYRGLHCPVCNKYLARLEELKEDFSNVGVELVAVSGDPEPKAVSMVERHHLTFPVAYSLSIEQMEKLGLYISAPRGPQETDRPFAEPGTFAVNAEGKLQLIEISNAPSFRADLSELLSTIKWIKEKNYPIRGTYD